MDRIAVKIETFLTAGVYCDIWNWNRHF